MPIDDLILLAIAAALAGFVDAAVGGGGLIQVPALFSVLPHQSAATLFGTNKLASIFGTASAAVRYARQINMPWKTILPAATAAFAFAYFGAAVVAWLPSAILRPMILGLLIIAAIHSFLNREFGQLHRPMRSGRAEMMLAALLGSAIGFYDGFFGPGTGSLLIFLFIRFFGFDFLHASAASKFVNAATNLAALAYFAPNGHVLPLLAIIMAASNILGAILGSVMALRGGSSFVRRMFLVVISLLIARVGWDTFRAW